MSIPRKIKELSNIKLQARAEDDNSRGSQQKTEWASDRQQWCSDDLLLLFPLGL